MSSKNKDIIIHDNQSSIFDIVEDTTTKIQSIQIKTKPPYHNEIFPNVKLVTLTDRCTLALNLCGQSCYLLDFIFYLSPTSFIVYSSSTEDVVKISNSLETSQKHYLCKDNALIVNVNYHDFYLKKLNKLRESNDFDAIFDILSKL